MGRRNAPNHSGKLVQLILRGRRSQALVRTNEDWQSLGIAAARMLFWCGGFVHGCRCEANEIRFAVQVAHAPIGAPGPAAYRRRKTQPIAPETIQLFTRRQPKRKQRRAGTPNSHEPARDMSARRPSVESIARAVAEYSHVAFEDMRSSSRKHAVSKAKAIATVLSTRNGATVAAAARLFNRSRSTLIEQAEHYRQTQPQIFADAESALAAFLDRTRP